LNVCTCARGYYYARAWWTRALSWANTVNVQLRALVRPVILGVAT